MVYIIVVNYKSWADTRDCLHSLLDSTFINWQAIVIDNGSDDSSLAKIKESLSTHEILKSENIPILTDESDLKKYDSKIMLFQSNKNLGFAGANNLIIRQLLNQKGYIWMLNPDMVVQEDTLKNLYECASIQNDNNVWGMTIKSFFNREKIEIVGGGKVNTFSGTVNMIKDYGLVDNLDYINGSSLFTSVSTFDEVGLFSEEYFLYWEETDWCFKAKKRGISFQVCRNAIGFDKGATSIGRGYLSDYYYGRNSLIFLKEHFSNFHILSASLISLLRVIYRFLTGKKERAKGLLFGVIDYLRGKRGRK